MNVDDLLQMGAKVFRSSNLSGDAGTNLNTNDLVAALSGLTSGDGKLDLQELVSNLKTGGLGDLARSWLGDGQNDQISPDQLSSALGPDTINDFASKLGISVEEAAGGLSDALPQMVDKGSSGGSLLDSIGGVEGALGFAKKLFRS